MQNDNPSPVNQTANQQAVSCADQSTTIRPVTSDDMPALMPLIEAVGLFTPDEIEGMREMLTDYFAGNLGSDHFWITDDDQGLAGAAYYAPERMTEGTWNLYFIGIHPDRRREGRASAMLRYVEVALAARGERLLLVETSSDPTFERAWALYRQSGYDQEARIRDFYTAGQDKIVFRKALAATPIANRQD